MYQYACMAFDLEKVDIDGFEAKCNAISAKPSITIYVSSQATLCWETLASSSPRRPLSLCVVLALEYVRFNALGNYTADAVESGWSN